MKLQVLLVLTQVWHSAEGHRLHQIPAADQSQAASGEPRPEDGQSEKQYVPLGQRLRLTHAYDGLQSVLLIILSLPFPSCRRCGLVRGRGPQTGSGYDVTSCIGLWLQLTPVLPLLCGL